MKLRTTYRRWILERWFKAFLLGHIKDLITLSYELFIAVLGLIIAIPYLVLEGIVRLILFCLGKYKVIEK